MPKVSPMRRYWQDCSNNVSWVSLFLLSLVGQVNLPSHLTLEGLSFTSALIAIEELAKVDPGISLMCDVQTFFNQLLVKWGSPDQKKKYLPQTTAKSMISMCISEENAGSDAFSMTTRAVIFSRSFLEQSGPSRWPLCNQRKESVGHERPSSGCILRHGQCRFLQRIQGNYSLFGRKRHSWIRNRKERGQSNNETTDHDEFQLGMRSSVTCKLHFKDVKVHKTQILGEFGKGYKVAIEGLNEGRIAIAAQMLGLAQGCFERTLPYLHQRKQFGQSIASFQVWCIPSLIVPGSPISNCKMRVRNRSGKIVDVQCR